MRTIRILLVTFLLLPAAAHASTYIVPTDAEMIQGSDDVVVVTGVTSVVQRNERGGIVTHYTLRIEETIKGNRKPGDHLVLTEFGGVLGDAFIVSPGTPEYVSGQRYLVFTETDPEGEPITYGMSLGQFKLVEDDKRLLAVRSGITGLNQNLESRSERHRDARLFMDYIRGIVAQRISPDANYFVTDFSVAADATKRLPQALFSRSSYLIENYRWEVPTYGFTMSGTQGGADGPGSVSTANSLWSGTPSTINLSDGPQDNTKTCSLCDGNFDGENVVEFNRPGLPSGVAGRAWFGGGGTHTVPGDPDTFNNITEGDVHVDDMTFSQCLLNIVMTHEIGHTLGLRHSNEPPAGGESTSNAFMNSSVSCALYGAGTLKQYDVDAASTVNGSGPVCTPPGISVQPANKTITPPDTSTSLSVTATGSAPFTYQWFVGNSGNTSTPIGTSSSSINVSPVSTTNYWVRITGQCAPAVDSNTVTVTVAPCAPPQISNHTIERNIVAGTSTQLTVNATGTSLHYQWFIGPLGNTSQPTGADNKNLTVSPTETTSYWVRVTGACQPEATSGTILVTVEPCPEIIVATPTVTPSGSNAILSIEASSSASGSLSYAWFRGSTPGVGGTPVGSTKSVTVVATLDVRTYWVRVTNSCNTSVVSELVSVASCSLPGIATQPLDQTIVPGANATLSLVLAGNPAGVTVTWYRGTAPDKTNQIGTGTATSINVGPLTVTTSYWAAVRNSCGEVSTRTAIITVQAPVCTAPAVTTSPVSQQVKVNTPVSLSVAATGTAALQYQWFEGLKGDTAKPMTGATLSTFTSEKLLKPTSFWARVTNACGTANSEAALVTVTNKRRRAAGH